MIDIQKLIQSASSFDVSKIDFPAVAATVAKRRDILISIIIIIGTLIAVRYVLMSSGDRKATSQTELTQLEEKQKAALALETKQKEFDTFQQKTPEGFETETEIIKAVVELAQAQGVSVIFYNPKEADEENSYTIQTVDFVFESSYEKMLGLVQAIEKNKINLSINSWKNTAMPAYQYDNRGVPKRTKEDTLQWEVSISSTKVKK